jgi:hypothetical protein
MKIKKKTFSFEVDGTDGLATYNIYYEKKSQKGLTYDSTYVNFPIIQGQLLYSHILPDDLPGITDGTYMLGVSTLDAEGNETDIVPLEYTFDFIPPVHLPKNLTVE